MAMTGTIQLLPGSYNLTMGCAELLAYVSISGKHPIHIHPIIAGVNSVTRTRALSCLLFSGNHPFPDSVSLRWGG